MVIERGARRCYPGLLEDGRSTPLVQRSVAKGRARRGRVLVYAVACMAACPSPAAAARVDSPLYIDTAAARTRTTMRLGERVLVRETRALVVVKARCGGVCMLAEEWRGADGADLCKI